ncbi:MAG: glycosyltransferase family 39 protein [Anaerolineae bacterium]|nr:glycosyltransferase family 39 protein [Anaerolineae bacterium]
MAVSGQHNTQPSILAERRWLILPIVPLAFAARLYRLDVQSLWFDESLSALFASEPFALSTRAMLEEGLHHSPLYYILLRPFAAFGFSEFSLRFFSVALGVLAIPLLAQLGRLTVGPKAGLLAAFLLAINPFHVWYSQEARMYTLLVVASIGAMLFLARNLQSARLWNWLGLTLFVSIGINVHHFAFFIPLIQFVFLVVSLRRNYRLLRSWAGSQLLAGLSLIPWIITVLDWGHFYFSSASNRPATWLDPLKTLWNFSLGYTETVTPGIVVFMSLFVILLAFAAVSIPRNDARQLLLLWMLLPPIVVLLLSLRLPMYLDRYLIVAFPPFLLLVSAGIHRFRQPVLRFAIGTVVTGAMLMGLYRVYYDTSVYSRTDWRGVGQYLESNGKPGDVITPWYYQYLVPLIFYYHGQLEIRPVIVQDKVNLPNSASPLSQRAWVIIAYPNDSSHLVGHCQPFDMKVLGSPPAAENWWRVNQVNLVEAVDFSCIRLEGYQLRP